MLQTKEITVLLEFPDEARAYLEESNRLGVDPAAAQVISLDAKARVWLLEQGVQCQDSLAYFSSEAHARALRKSNELLKWVEPRLDIVDHFGIKDAYSNAVLWYSRFVIHHLIWNAEVLAEIHRQHPNSILRVPTGSSDGRSSPFIQDSERYLGIMAEIFSGTVGNDFQSIPMKDPKTKSSLGSGRAKWMKWIIRGIGGRMQRSALRKLGKQRPLLSLTRNYRMDAVVREARDGTPQLPWVIMADGAWALNPVQLAKKAIKAVTPGSTTKQGDNYLGETWLRVLEWTTREDPEFKGNASRCIQSICREIEADRDTFTHMGVSFGPQFASKLRGGILGGLPTIHREVCAYDEVINLLKPRLIMAPFGRRAQHALGELAKRAGIPSLLISHGTFARAKGELEEMGWDFHAYGLFHGSFTHAALQTPPAEEYAKGIESTAEFVRTGPLSWGAKVNRDNTDALRQKLLPGNESQRIVMHAGTPKGRSYMHYHVYETMDEYISGMRDLISAVEQVPNTHLIIKFRPFYLTVKELQTLLPVSDSYSISVEESFLDVLGVTDLLVSFSSTTIEEALQNQVPVMQYGGDGRYQHIEGQDVTPSSDVKPGAVYSVRSAEHLAAGLERILDTNGRAPLANELFTDYVYGPGQFTPFPQLVSELAGKPLATEIGESVPAQG